MEIHFYDSQTCVLADVNQYYGWVETIGAINNKVEIIHTTQMGILSTALFDEGYQIFIHEQNNLHFEIILGTNNTHTNREIRGGHNLFKMWQSGEFCKAYER